MSRSSVLPGMRVLWRYRRLVWAAALLILGPIVVSTSWSLVRGAPPPPPKRLPESVARRFDQLLSRDAIRPVYDPQLVAGSDARLSPDELVIGVQIRGVARAYPVGFLNFREMVDDRIGPVPFLVTW